MYFIGFVLAFLGTYLLYLRSDKHAHRPFSWEKQLKKGRKTMGWISSLLLFLSATVFVYNTGIFGGCCISMLLFFGMASTIMLVRPLLTAEKSKLTYARK